MSALLYWLITAAAVIHVLEEYFTGWLDWAQEQIAVVDLKSFIVFNILFIVLCIAAALFDFPVLRLAVICLIGVNALIHVGGSLMKRTYMPGAVSAVIAYIPLTTLGLIRFFNVYSIKREAIVLGFCLGPLIMAVPFGFQKLRERRKLRAKPR